MPNPFFKFKQFTIHHDKCAMKVGTDGVLLGAWCDVEHASRILDIGTGSGLIALMCAQRSKAQIDALEIDQHAAAQANENFVASSFAERIKTIHQDFVDFSSNADEKKQYDHIVSNPPYFVNALKCDCSKRSTARHDDTLPIATLINLAATLLNDNGKLSLVLPTEALSSVELAACESNLFISRLTHVLPKPEAASKRILIELQPLPCTTQTDTLVIELARHQYSDDYIRLTKAFYLKM